MVLETNFDQNIFEKYCNSNFSEIFTGAMLVPVCQKFAYWIGRFL